MFLIKAKYALSPIQKFKPIKSKSNIYVKVVIFDHVSKIQSSTPCFLKLPVIYLLEFITMFAEFITDMFVLCDFRVLVFRKNNPVDTNKTL